jgi:23S rRNA (adenine2030-N6)-methyltransferase
MKYRHSFHAGNFADVHKHVTLLALLTALKRKDKGFAYLETHAGRGAYDLSGHAGDESAAGIGRFLAAGASQGGASRCGASQGGASEIGAADSGSAEELRAYAILVGELRKQQKNPRAYPGSPLIAAHELRAGDRAIFGEIIPAEAHALERAVEGYRNVRVELGDGFERLRAWLPPPERRGLLFIDPPYEETRNDFDRVGVAIADALKRFQTGVIAIWYPIKEERETRSWLTSLASAVQREMIVSELWLYPRDSRVALNGSGMLIVNPPYLVADRMAVWLPELQARLDVGSSGGASVRSLP